MTSKEKMLKLSKLVRAISRSKESNFYKNIWGNAFVKNGGIDFSFLPTINIKDIIKCRFDKRIYIKNNLFVKIIYHDDIPYLLARTETDISKENYGEVQYERPLVFFESSHESIEKGIWLHCKNILPLIAEDNLDVTLMIAGRYEIDSMVGDTESIKKLLTGGPRYIDCKKIINITVIDSCFEKDITGTLQSIFPFANVQLILALPETGSLGFTCKRSGGNIIFHPENNTIIEISEDRYLIATRLIMPPTPIMRYKTDIVIKSEENNCQCESELSFSLQDK